MGELWWVRRVAFIGLAALMAGCSGDAPAAPLETRSEAPEPIVEDVGPDFDAATGAIRGIVTDDELVPLAGVNITLDRDGFATVSDETGQFRFPRLAALDYVVTARLEGFEPLSRKATVLTETIAWANFTLIPVASTEPYVEVLSRTGYIEVGQGILDQTVLRPLNLTCPRCKFPFRFDPTTAQVRFEVSFRATYDWPNTEERVYHAIFRNTTSDAPSPVTDQLVSSGYVPNRGAVTLNKPDAIKPGENRLTFYLGADHPFPMFQQRVDIWVSIAHYEVLPEQWTALPPG